MRRSATRRRPVRPLPRIVAYRRPQARATSPSSGSASQLEAAHCRRSCRRPRSCSSTAACGPAASSASVMAEMAVSSGRSSLSIKSRSMTTEVSRSPRGPLGVLGCGECPSDVDILNYERIEVGAKPFGIYSRRGPGRCLDHGPRHKPASGHRSQFGHRRTVAGDGQMLTCLYFPQDRRRLVPKLTLGNGTHEAIVQM